MNIFGMIFFLFDEFYKFSALSKQQQCQSHQRVSTVRPGTVRLPTAQILKSLRSHLQQHQCQNHQKVSTLRSLLAVSYNL